MRHDDFQDSFDRQFASMHRAQRRSMALVLLIQLVWAVGSIAVLGGFLWFLGSLAGAW